MATATFDYVIVGSGTAGSVLSHRLSEDPNVSICVLEAGGRDLSPFIHVPAGFMKTLVDPKVNWRYEMMPSEGTAGRVVMQPRGKTLGGSSSINGHVYNRGQRMDFDVWAQMGNRGWGYADILPYFKRSERREGDGDDTFRGRSGPFVVTDLDWHHPLCDAFIDGAASLGIPRNADYNGASQDGVGYFQRSIYKRRRMSAARAYLRTASARGNVTVMTGAHVSRILLEGKTARGVAFRRGGELSEVQARVGVLLCGGAINSPQLLQLSGIGPGWLLQERGIEVKHELPGVGENLRDHFAVRTVARVKDTDTINERSRGLRLGLEIAKYFAGLESILTLQPSLVHCFWHSNEKTRRSDLQVTFTPASYKEGVQSQLDDFPGVTVAPWQQRPESRGYVRVRSSEPFEPPDIQPNYLAQEEDRQVLLGGLRLARRLLRTDALAPYYVREELPGDEVRTDDEMLDFARGRGTTCFHVMGTCKMGPAGDPQAVVDDTLKVHGLENLSVIDASIMPTMPSANLNASTLMIAEKASDMLRRRSPLPAETLSD